MRDPRPPLGHALGAYKDLFGVDLTRQISVHTGRFLMDFIFLADRPEAGWGGSPFHENRMNLFVSSDRLGRGQAICHLAQLARLLIRIGAGRGELARISGHFAELTLLCRRRFYV